MATKSFSTTNTSPSIVEQINTPSPLELRLKILGLLGYLAEFSDASRPISTFVMHSSWGQIVASAGRLGGYYSVQLEAHIGSRYPNLSRDESARLAMRLLVVLAQDRTW